MKLHKTEPMSKPTVSVLITTYNHAEHIAKCLDSVLMQKTNFSFELVIGEDGSDDGTQEICKQYAERYPEIIRLAIRDQSKKVYLYGRATGKYNLMQTLLDGRGEYFALCDGDDYWTDEHKLQKQVDFMQSNPTFSFCSTDRRILKDGVISRDEGLEVAFSKSGGAPIVITKRNFFSPYLVKSNTILLRRNCLDFELLQERYTEVKDTFIYYILLNKGDGIVQPWLTSDYRVHQGGMWTSLSRFGMAKMNHHTIRGMYRSYLGEDEVVKEFYRGTLFAYFKSSVRNYKWRDIWTSFSEGPVICIRGALSMLK